MAEPDVSRPVASDGVYLSGGNAADGNEAAILEVGNPPTRGDPNSAVIVLKEGFRAIVWQSTIGNFAHCSLAAWAPKLLLIRARRQAAVSLAVSLNLSVTPSVQAITSPEPNATIPRGQDGPNERIRQTLLDRNRGDGEIAKAVESIT